METNSNMEVSYDVMEIANDIRDNLNSSLTTLTLNDQNNETNRLNEIELNEAETSTTPTKQIQIPIRKLPVRNVPEKIIFCVDTCVDTNYTAFIVEDGRSFAPLFMLRRIIEIFVQNKSFIDQRHEYALMSMESKDVRWIKDFSNNPNNIINALQKEINETEQSDEFDLSTVLEMISQKVIVPEPMNPLHDPPPYVVRMIMLYSRSNSTFSDRKTYEELLSNPYFTVDTIFTNEPTSVLKTQQIFNSLRRLDEKIYSYKFEVGRNATMLHDSMAKLLMHPLQRPPQCLISFDINKYDFNGSWKRSDKEE